VVTTPQLLFTNLQSGARSAFTDLPWVGKGFTDPLQMVGISDVGKAFIDWLCFTDRLRVANFMFYRPSVQRHTKIFMKKAMPQI
jgi:hypothetical protein